MYYHTRSNKIFSGTNKIAYFSILFGSTIFAMIFIFQLFFKIYPNAINLPAIWIFDVLLLGSYITIAHILLSKNIYVNRIILYIVLPFFLNSFIFLLFQLYYRSPYYLYPVYFLFYYCCIGTWVISIVAIISDIILSCIFRNFFNKDSQK